MAGNRAIYSDGWVAATVHKAPWEAAPRHKLTEDVWELYNVDADFSESTDLAAGNPAKLKELQALFMKEAERYRVLPIDDRTLERFDPNIAGRPDLMGGRKSLTVYAGMTGMMENAFINVKNQSVTITADVEIPAGGANGVILAQGGRFGGWSVYVKDGKPAYTYNHVGLHEYTVTGTQALAPGKATIVVDFAYDGNGRGKGGTATITVNGKSGGIRARRAHQCERLLGRRGRRRGRGRRDQRELGVRPTRERVHRHDRQGAGGREIRTRYAIPSTELAKQFFVIDSKQGSGCVVAHDLAVRGGLLEALQARLPGVNNEAVIAAMVSVENRTFTIWEAPDSAPDAGGAGGSR